MVTYNDKVYARNNPTRFPGTFRITRLTVEPWIGGEIDITPQMDTLTIYESIMSPTIYASIRMVDTTNLMKKLEIMGGEIVHAWVTDESVETETKYRFRLFKVTDRDQPNFGVLSYTIHLVSEEMYRDSFIYISKAYRDDNGKPLPYEQAVSDILYNPDYLASEKPMLIEETNQAYCFIIPNWSPLDAISWIAARSQSASPNRAYSNYFFFENSRHGGEFAFVSLETLFDKTTNVPYATVTLDPFRPTQDRLLSFDRRGIDDMLRFEQVKVVKSFDILENAKMGMYVNRIKMVDIMDRLDVDHEYRYLDEFEDAKHLTGRIGASYPFARPSFEPTWADNAPWKVHLKHNGLFSQDEVSGFGMENWLVKRQSTMQQTENFKIVGELPGNQELICGMQLQYDFPNPQDISSNKNPDDDLMYSGAYLVTAVKRVFKRSESYRLQVEMVKDSLSLSLSGEGA